MSSNYGILFPHGATSSLFGSWALSQGHKLSFYCPGGLEYNRVTRHMVTDLDIIGCEKARLQGEDTSALSVIDHQDFSGIGTLLIPNMDLLPQNPDNYYVDLCMNKFRCN